MRVHFSLYEWISSRQYYLLIVVGGMCNNLYIVVQILLLIRADERETENENRGRAKKGGGFSFFLSFQIEYLFRNSFDTFICQGWRLYIDFLIFLFVFVLFAILEFACEMVREERKIKSVKIDSS